jgi:cardiolipin synthase
VEWVDRRPVGECRLPEKVSPSIIVPGKNKTLLNRLRSMIDGSTDVLCIASFLIEEDEIKTAIVGAATRGVRVYILTAAELKALKDARDDGEDENDVKAHIAFMKELYGKALVRTGQNFHAKFILADPLDPRKRKGLLFTGNLTGSLYKSADIALILNPEQICGLYHQFLIGFWKMATGELTGDGYKDLPSEKKPPEDIPDFVASSSVDFNAGEHHVGIGKRLINFIQKTDGPIIAFAWSFDWSNDVVSELVKAIENSRTVEILVNSGKNHPIYPIALERLHEKGAAVFGYPFFHAKGLVSSEKGRARAIVMTANFDQGHIEGGYNSLIEMQNPDQAEKIRTIVEAWKGLAKYELGERIRG